MDLLSYNAEDLSSLRSNDYFFEPASEKIYQFRSKEGKAIVVREVGSTHISKLFKNTLKTVLKVDGEFDRYQVINISETSVSLFNVNIGETFEVGFGDAADSVEEMRNAFNKGDEVVAEIFDYDDIKVLIKLSIASSVQEQSGQESTSTEPSEAELKRIQEIEAKKAKKRPFGASEPTSKPIPKPAKAEPKAKAPAPTKISSKKTTAKSSKKPAAKKAAVAPVKEQPKAPKEVKKEPEKPKEETKEEKKAREKREKEEQKAREKREKEEKKAREKAEKEAKKKKK